MDIKKVAQLASLELKDKDQDTFETQLGEVIDYNIRRLKKVESEKIEATYLASSSEDLIEEDEARPSLTQEEVLANATEEYNGFFKVKAILE